MHFHLCKLKKIHFLANAYNFDKYAVDKINTGGTPYDYGIK